MGGLGAVLLDLDGTLIDSRADLAEAVNVVLAEEDLVPLPLDRVLGFVGRGARNLLERSFAAAGRGAEPLSERAVLRWLEVYDAICLDRTRPYPGAVEALDAWRDDGLRLGIVTNKPASITARILAGLGLDGRFGVVLGGDSLPARKPSGEPVRFALETLGVPPGRALMVGDSEVDVLAGRAAGVRTLACTWGIGDGERLLAAGPDLVAGSWAEALMTVRAELL
ncbi:HAD-IA family hydrolase [Myxococcota bacterium]|nr:HAD-IA family hydrolase [Myxococcota bacterium]